MKQSGLLLLVLILLASAPARSSDTEARYSILLSRPLSVLVVRGGRVDIKGELTIRDGRALFRNRHGVLHALALEEIDLEGTARENGISEAELRRFAETSPVVASPVVAPAPADPRERVAEVATMQAVTAVGLAAREGDRSSARDLGAARPDRWTFFTGVTSLGETNIDNQAEGTPDAGVIPTVGFNYRNRGKRGTIEGSYTAAFHSYSRSEEWNRTSHNLGASFEPRWRGRWRSETEGEISIKGANEDRDLSDRYALTQRFRLRTTRRGYLRLSAGYRLKLYGDDPAGDEENPFGAIDYRQRFGSGGQWGLGYKVEENLADSERRAYRRETIAAALTIPLAPESFATIAVRRHEQLYPNRLVRLGDDRVPREDERWLGSFSLSRRFFDVLGLAVEYQYETRQSNDPEKAFDGHSLGVSLIRFW